MVSRRRPVTNVSSRGLRPFPPGSIEHFPEGNCAPGTTCAKAKCLPEETAKKNAEVVGGNDGEASIWEDLPSIGLLTFLYFLQGLPIGIAGALIGILKENGASYAQVSRFLLCSWPFSLKILWAPVVDSIYSQKFGRRKSWLVPIQFLIGASMLIISGHIMSWLEQLNITILTASMFLLYFLAATQDITVDGWALTMLKNKGWASSCNGIGQSVGILTSSAGFFMLASLKIIDLHSFLKVCSVVYFVATTLVALFVHETSTSKPHGSNQDTKEALRNLWNTYETMVGVVRLPIVTQLLVVLLTWKFGFSCTDAALYLKFQEKAFSKETITYMRTLMGPIEVVVPMLISSYTTSKRPLDLAMWTFLPRLALGVLACGLLVMAPAKEEVGLPFTVAAIIFMIVQTVLITVMFTSQIAFFARVSDPTLGGSYMTLLNTFANLGYLWSTMVATRLVDLLTISSGSGVVAIDGFYTTSACCTIMGLLWFFIMRGKVEALQNAPLSAWRVGGAQNAAKMWASL